MAQPYHSEDDAMKAAVETSLATYAYENSAQTAVHEDTALAMRLSASSAYSEKRKDDLRALAYHGARVTRIQRHRRELRTIIPLDEAPAQEHMSPNVSDRYDSDDAWEEKHFVAAPRLLVQQTSGKSKDESGDEDEDEPDEAAAFELLSKHQLKRSLMPIMSTTLKKAKMDHVPLSDDEAKDSLSEDDNMFAEEASGEFNIVNNRLFDTDASSATALEDIGNVFLQLHPSHPHMKAFLERVESMSGQCKFLVLPVYDADINTLLLACLLSYASCSPHSYR